MFVWTKPWQELWKRKPKSLLYAFSAMLPMAIMLVVWAFMGTFPFGDKS